MPVVTFGDALATAIPLTLFGCLSPGSVRPASRAGLETALQLAGSAAQLCGARDVRDWLVTSSGVKAQAPHRWSDSSPAEQDAALDAATRQCDKIATALITDQRAACGRCVARMVSLRGWRRDGVLCSS